MNFVPILFVFLLREIKCSTKEDVCNDPKIDAIVSGENDGELYVFNNNNYWKFNYESVSLSEPQAITDIWTDVITPVDAADVVKYYNQQYYLIFLKDNSYWMYESKDRIENKPKLVSTGDIKTQFEKRVVALQISPHFETRGDKLKVIASVCDEDNSIYDCVMNTTSGFFIEKCLVYPYVVNIFPEKQCLGLAYLNSTITVISGYFNMITTNSSRNEIFDKLNIRRAVFECKTAMMSKIAIPVVIGCGIIIIANLAVVIIVFKQTRNRSQNIKEKEHRVVSDET